MTKKGGTVLYNKETNLIGLVYREKRKDISFPKGHLENNETIEECAVRETIEETGRLCHIVKELGIISYVTDKNEEVQTYMYLAYDDGKYNGISPDPEVCIWTEIDDVEKVLSFDNLKEFFHNIKDEIK